MPFLAHLLSLTSQDRAKGCMRLPPYGSIQVRVPFRVLFGEGAVPFWGPKQGPSFRELPIQRILTDIVI